MGIKDSWSILSGAKKGAIIGTGILAAAIIATAVIVPTVIYTNPYRDLGNEITVWMPWQPDALNYTSMEEITDYYNDHNDKGDYDVKLKTIGSSAYKESGYTELPELVKKDLKSGQKGVRKLPDLIVSGQDVLSILSTFGDEDYTIALKDTGFDTSLLNPDLIQDNVSGIDQDSTNPYAISLLTTQSLGIDTQFLLWLEINGILNLDGVSFMEGITSHEEDTKALDNLWRVKDLRDSYVPLEVTDATFKSLSSLETLGETVSSSIEPIKMSAGEYGVIGYTNPQTELMTMAQSNSGENDIITSTDNGNHYNFLHNDDPTFETTEAVYSTFENGINNGAFWLPNGQNQYSSNLIATHKLLVTVGSTSGTSYNTNNEIYEAHDDEYAAGLNSDEIVYISDTSTFDEGDNAIYKQQGPSIMAVDHKTKDQEERTEQIGKFLNFFAGNDKVFKSDDVELTPTQYFGKQAGYVATTTSATEVVEADISSIYGDAPGANLILEQLNDTSAEWMAEPADANTASFWSTVQANMKQEYETSLTGGTVSNWDEFSSDLLKTVNTNGWDNEITKSNKEVIINKD